jgi:SAM-dependent methyltransferase
MDATQWNARYATAEYIWKAEPNRFLPEQTAHLRVGRALDLGCGEGRNAVWLAEQGWAVTGVDFSTVGLDKARRMATERKVDVEWICADATNWLPPADGFDLVVVFYLQLRAKERRRAMRVAVRALAAGGTLLVVAHDAANLTGGTGGPADPAVLYRPGTVVADLRATAIDLSIERAETVERPVPGADQPALDCLVRARRSA